ncbi:hypothetical protein [Marinobacter sp.]|uniref:hypothetical protein n=1 Tax=Marinobacter sp. TaxID=50741 RepID=UPI003A91826B
MMQVNLWIGRLTVLAKTNEYPAPTTTLIGWHPARGPQWKWALQYSARSIYGKRPRAFKALVYSSDFTSVPLRTVFSFGRLRFYWQESDQ